MHIEYWFSLFNLVDRWEHNCSEFLIFSCWTVYFLKLNTFNLSVHRKRAKPCKEQQFTENYGSLPCMYIYIYIYCHIYWSWYTKLSVALRFSQFSRSFHSPFCDLMTVHCFRRFSRAAIYFKKLSEMLVSRASLWSLSFLQFRIWNQTQ